MTQLRIEDRQLALSATEGFRRLESANWADSKRANEEFLALLALRLVLVGYLIGNVSRTTTPDGTVTIEVRLGNRPAPGERLDAAHALLDPVSYYAEIAGISYTARASDTGAIPVPVLIAGGVVAVSIVAAEAYVVIYVAEKVGTIVDNALKRADASREIQRADAEVIKLVNQHVEREQAAGQTLALDDATRLAISGLQSRVGDIVQKAYSSEQSKGFPPWVVPTAAGLAAVSIVAALVVAKKRKGKNHE